ncbi:MAG: hypothetical protein ACP5IY_07855, partial [Halothiobacillaceae bacterium]
LVPPAWLFAVWISSLVEREISYRIASALLLGSMPICAVMFLVAGNDWLEWAANAWCAVVMLNVLFKQNEEWAAWL